jgi:putative flippase GtrA
VREPSKSSTRKTKIQLFQYLFVGGIATVVDIGMFSFFAQALAIDYRIAIVLGFSCGVVVNFTLCNWIVFAGKRKPWWAVFTRHYLASLSVLAINEIMMISLVEMFNFNNLILAKIMSSGVAFILNFAIKKSYVYNDDRYRESVTGSSKPLLFERRSRR